MNITTLDNGLRVVTYNKDFKKAVIGVYVNTGLINETDDINGISHVLEHMAFKGTTTKTAKELAEQIEGLGGYMNAYTSNEVTAYYVGVLPENWKIAIDFLSDILQNSTFPEEEFEKERNVILEELSRSHDNPTHVLFNHMMYNTYKNSNLKNPILGPAENIKKFTANDLKEYMHKWYALDNMIVSACGNIDHDEFVEYVKASFNNLPTTCEHNTDNIGFAPGRYEFTDKFDQAHVLLTLNGINAGSMEESLFGVFTNILNGGMSCRLFQEIREKRGLAYAVSNVDDTGKNWGYFGIYLGVNKEKIEEAIEASKNVLKSMISDISDEELEKAKNITLFNLANKYDSCSQVSISNAYDLIYKNEIPSYEELKGRIQGMTKEDIINFSKRYIDENFSITILKPNE